jgi:hypothetical protein
MHIRYPVITELCEKLANVFVGGPRVLPGKPSKFGYPKTRGIRYSIKKPGRVFDTSWLSPLVLARIL